MNGLNDVMLPGSASFGNSWQCPILSLEPVAFLYGPLGPGFGAQAVVLDFQLLTRDAAHYKATFPKVRLITP